MMVEEKYIFCRRCSEIHHVTLFGKTPEYVWVGGEVRESCRDDWRDFMRRHAGHKLEALKSVGNTGQVSGQTGDPMKTSYVEVTDGQELLLMRSYRKSIQEPLSFELIRGRLVLAGITMNVQENEIRKEMKRHFSWKLAEPISDDKIELFVRLYREIADGLDPEEIEISGRSYTNSFEYRGLDFPAKQALIERCQPHFSPAEMGEIARFIETHQDDDGVMALRLTKRYMIEESKELVYS